MLPQQDLPKVATQLKIKQKKVAKLILSLCLSRSINKPRHEKTGFLHMRKQRRRSASR